MMKHLVVASMLMVSVGALADDLKISPLSVRQDFSFSNQKYNPDVGNILGKARANGVQSIGIESRGTKTSVSVAFNDNVEYLSCREFNLDKTSVAIDLLQNKTMLSFGGELYSPKDVVAGLNDCMTNMNLNLVLENRIKERKIQEWKEFSK